MGDVEELFAAAFAHHRAGRPAEAQAAYQRILAIEPNHAESLHLLGVVNHQLGKSDAAIELIGRAIDINAGDARLHNNLGIVLDQHGEPRAALAAYRRALALRPGYAEALNNLGNAHKHLGELDAAVEAYQRALALRPDYAEASHNLALALRDLGRMIEAAAALRRAVAAAPDRATYRCHYGRVLARLPANHHAPWLREDLIRALDEGWVRSTDLVNAVAPILLRDNALPPGDALFSPAALAGLAADRLLLTFLTNAIAAHRDLELLVARVRRSLLALLDIADPLPTGTAIRALAAAVAHQSFNTEYVIYEEPAETVRIEALQTTIAAGASVEGPAAELQVLVLAAYRPLGRTGLAEALRARRWSAEIDAVVTRQIIEPDIEVALRPTIARLTPIEDDISQEVRAQYEENPYPRWFKHLLMPPPRPAAAMISDWFSHADVSALRGTDPTEVLVAGCGTGQHPCLTARSYSRCSVLAIDLSLASLSYAVRKAREQRIDNVTFAQADILALGGIGRRFHIVESVGVLHHMREPLQGWRVLVGLLRPGGFMKIGLYGEVERAPVIAARELVQHNGFASDLAGIRASRRTIFALGDDAPAKPAIRHPDFYSASLCRDLIFHVQEHSYLVRDIKAALGHLGLRFIGFDPLLGSELLDRYDELFPGDPTRTNLDNWQVMESDPANFVPLLFWVQKPAA